MNHGQLSDTIRNRRSIRSFNQRELESEILEGLILEANKEWAMYYSNENVWSLSLLTTSEEKQRLASAARKVFAGRKPYKWMPEKILQAFENRMSKVPAFLIVKMSQSGSEENKLHQYARTAAFIQQLVLLAWEQGIGAVWASDDLLRDEFFCRYAELGEDEVIISILYLGYFDKKPRGKKRKTSAEKLQFITDKDERVVDVAYRHELAEIIDTAVWAPTHHLREPWRFIASEQRLYILSEWSHNPLVQQEDLGAVFCALHNIRLLANAKGWLAREASLDQIPAALELQGSERVVAILEWLKK